MIEHTSGEHTPGPWEWEPECDHWGDCGPNLRSAPMGKAWDEFWGADGMGRGKNREDCPPSPRVLHAWGHDAWGIDVSDADARLIAAAPDLLAVLQRVVSRETEAEVQRLVNEHYGGDCTITEALEIAFEICGAKAAIAKATGAQP